MPPPGPRAKIARSKKHLEELLAAVEAFHASEPYTIRIEPDPAGGWLARVVPWPPDVPVGIALAFGDLVHNLRAALDHLICDLVADNRPDQLGDWTGFPIVRNAKALKSQIPSQMRGTRNDVKQAVLAQRPHQGGSDVLWPLHRLDILDKHRLIIPAIAANESVNAGPMMAAGMQEAAEEAGMIPPAPFDLWIKPANPCEDEAGVVFSDQTRDKPVSDMQFKMNLAVFEPGAVDCESLTPLATRLIEGVEGIVHSFDQLFSSP